MGELEPHDGDCLVVGRTGAPHLGASVVVPPHALGRWVLADEHQERTVWQPKVRPQHALGRAVQARSERVQIERWWDTRRRC